MRILTKHCNDLKKWLMKKVYKEKMIRKQILKAREHSEDNVFEREKP